MVSWRGKKLWWIASFAAGSLALATLVVGVRTIYSPPAKVAAAEPVVATNTGEQVATVRPTAGGIVRKTVQPGSAHSFESAGLCAKVSGYLKSQNVDIGSRVKRGDLLAELDVPELVQELERNKALLRQAQAEIVQAESQVASMIADHKATEAYVSQAEANVQRCESETAFADKQYRRMQYLHGLKSVEERLVDEKFDQLNAAQAGELAARRAVFTAQQQVAAAWSKVVHAKADLVVAQAKVEVVQTEVAKTAVLLSYTRITSPYDGVVTQRHFHPGAFIRAADQGAQMPLFWVDRTDLMRIVVQVPDRDVPYTQPGDRSVVFFDALPTKNFTGKVARISASEDRESRTMRVEIDVPNSQGTIRDGMYGQVEIELEEASGAVTIPSACLVGNVSNNLAQVFVVDQGKARMVNINVGKDTGALVEVESGLTTSSEVILKPQGALADGMAVNAVAAQLEKKTGH